MLGSPHPGDSHPLSVAETRPGLGIDHPPDVVEGLQAAFVDS